MNKTVLILSAVIGIAFGLVMGPLFSSGPAEAFQVSIVAAILMAGILYIVLDITVKSQHHKYEQLDKLIDQPIIHAATCNIYADEKIYCCRLCFCKDRIVLIYVEKKPYSMVILLYSEIVKWEQTSPTRVAVHTQGHGTFYIQMTEAMSQTIRDKVGISII